MPLYEYECDSCGHRFEVIQKFSDPLVEVCPKCGCKVEKLLSSPAIQFKGSGFYINDYARKGSSEGASEKPSEGASEKSSEGASEKSEKSAETVKAAGRSDDKSSPSSSNTPSSSGSTDTVSAGPSSKQS